MGVGVAKHLTNVLQMKSVYWFIGRSVPCLLTTMLKKRQLK